jgi:hypothetical protein
MATSHSGNHRAVLITRRSGGGLQTSPVLVRVDPSYAPSFLHGQGGSWSWPATGVVEPSFQPSVGLTALTIFDAGIAWLTYREYRKQLAVARR